VHWTFPPVKRRNEDDDGRRRDKRHQCNRPLGHPQPLDADTEVTGGGGGICGCQGWRRRPGHVSLLACGLPASSDLPGRPNAQASRLSSNSTTIAAAARARQYPQPRAASPKADSINSSLN